MYLSEKKTTISPSPWKWYFPLPPAIYQYFSCTHPPLYWPLLHLFYPFNFNFLSFLHFLLNFYPFHVPLLILISPHDINQYSHQGYTFFLYTPLKRGGTTENAIQMRQNKTFGRDREAKDSCWNLRNLNLDPITHSTHFIKSCQECWEYKTMNLLQLFRKRLCEISKNKIVNLWS